MKKIFSSVFFLLLIISVSDSAFAQISISGLPCAVGGGTTGYLYSLSGQLDSAHNVTWTIKGGVIAGTAKTSVVGRLSDVGSQVRVIWNAGIGHGLVKITNNRLGIDTIDVTIISFPNVISIGQKIVHTGDSVIIAGTGSAGSCVPLYDIWWERATEAGGAFIQLDGETGRDLAIVANQSAWFRRVLSVNGDVFYSNIISIDPQ